MFQRSVRAVAAAVTAATVLGGCGVLGGHDAVQNDPAVLTVTSPEFGHRVAIPAAFTCRGGHNPPLSWSGAPTSTKAFALVMDDVNTPIDPYVYWVVFNISMTTPDIQAGRIPPGALVAQNSAGHTSYSPPCPSGQHDYRFTIYALNAPLALKQGAGLDAASSAIASHAIGYGRLTAVARS